MTRKRAMTPAALKRWRESHNWTQAEAAEQLALCLSAYTHKEQGLRPVTKRDKRMMEIIDRNAAKKKATA
jgi:transcriptional regulator with XRE-family HTH domain